MTKPKTKDKDWEKEFEKFWEGFSYWYESCGGGWVLEARLGQMEDRIKPFIKKVRKDAVREVLEEFAGLMDKLIDRLRKKYLKERKMTKQNNTKKRVIKYKNWEIEKRGSDGRYSIYPTWYQTNEPLLSGLTLPDLKELAEVIRRVEEAENPPSVLFVNEDGEKYDFWKEK